jgi:hypothetical protein
MRLLLYEAWYPTNLAIFLGMACFNGYVILTVSYLIHFSPTLDARFKLQV